MQPYRKVLYVWFDAPIGYISNTKELLPDTWEKDVYKRQGMGWLNTL